MRVPISNAAHSEQRSLHLNTIQPSGQDLSGFHFVHFAGEQVAVDDDKIGAFARLEGADFLFGAHEPGVVDGVVADHFLPIEGLLGMDGFIQPTSFAREGDPHAKKGIVRIHAAQGADALHVIAAAAGLHPGIKQALERDEIF